MKVYFYWATLVCLPLLLINCENPVSEIIEEKEEVILSASPLDITFGFDGGTSALDITSNSIWKIEYNASLWSRPSIQTTQGDASITVTADANDLIEDRSMILTVTAEGAEDITIAISQEAKEPDPVEPTKPDFIDPDNTDMRSLTSMELSQLMKLGWNLGNSMEAINVNNGVFSGNELSWGNPAVTKELIDAIKAAGFNTVRIPVAWSHHIEDEATHKITFAWKQRVEEVVNYALANDMYAIINIHWDGGWMDHPDYAHQEEINEKLGALWQQIGVYFRDYDDYLIFAGTNEVHVEGDYGTPSAENADVQNSFNQTFVNAIRGTGGRNAYRHLAVQAYNTNIDHAQHYMTIPADEAVDRLMVEVHYYDPYGFSLQETGGKSLWGEAFKDRTNAIDDWGQEEWVDQKFLEIKTEFVDKGYPVILGEYGAVLRTEPENATFEEHTQARNYYLNYVTKSAIANGIVPCYWDNGYYGDNGFGLFNRETGGQSDEGAIQAIVSALDE